MKWTKLTTIKTILTSLFIFGFVFHTFNIWGLKLDTISLVLFLLALLPWSLKYIKNIDIPGLGKLSFSDLDNATSRIKKVEVKADEDEIIFNDTQEKEFTVNSDTKYLSFKARIFYSHEAGSQYLLKVKINEVILNNSHIINREKLRKIADGRTAPSWNENLNAWNILYSPDFVTNYSHPKYRVLNYDPYLFVFNISEFTKEIEKITIKFIHIGMLGNEAHKNSIIIRDVVVY